MWPNRGDVECGTVQRFSKYYKNLTKKIFSRKNFRTNRTNNLSSLPIIKNWYLVFLWSIQEDWWSNALLMQDYWILMKLYSISKNENINMRIRQVGQTIYPFCQWMFFLKIIFREIFIAFRKTPHFSAFRISEISSHPRLFLRRSYA